MISITDYTALLFCILLGAQGQTPVHFPSFVNDDLLIPCRHGQHEEFIWAVYWNRLTYVNGTKVKELMVEYDDYEDVFAVAPEWEHRLNFSWPSGNLTMYSLQHEDDGRYECQSRIGEDGWGIESFSDVTVYEKPMSFGMTWATETTSSCGLIIPRTRVPGQVLNCESVSKPEANLVWTFYRGGQEIGNYTNDNFTCDGAAPYPVTCSLPYQLSVNFTEGDAILHKCTMTYKYLDYTEIKEACIMYEPMTEANGLSMVKNSPLSSLFMSVVVCWFVGK